MNKRLIFVLAGLACSAAALSSLQAQGPNIKWSHPRALVEEPFMLTLTTDPPGGLIHYTTDGSPPSPETGDLYSEPLQIDKTTVLRAATSGQDGNTVVETRTFLFVDQVADQEAFPSGYVSEIISDRNGPSRPHTFDWAMDPEIVDDVANNGNLAEHLEEIPSLSLVLDVNDLNFLFENQSRRGVQYERAVSLELIYPDKEAYAGFEGFQIDAGIRMQGGGAGDQARKKSFRVLFKKDYGKGSLNYPLFESAVHFSGTAASAFDGVVLRAGGNTNWSKDDAWKHEPSTYLRDPLVRDSQIAISGIGSHSVFTHLYINGLYFGLYNIAERPDEKFLASYLGGEPEHYYSINHGGTVSGDPSLWNETVRTTARDLHQPERYEAMTERLNVEALCDYLLLNWLVGMGDWPHNNFYGGMRNEPAGQIRFFAWDSEYAFWTIDGYLGSNPTAWVHPSFDRGGNTLPELWSALSSNQDFLTTFADRVYKHCFNDGALTDANLKTRFQRLADFIENPIVAESARWGDSAWGREDMPHTRANDFIPNRDAVLELIEGNVAIFIDVLRDRAYYPEFDPPVLPSTREMVTSGFEVTMDNPNSKGDIYYTVDGSDPRLPGGMVSPTAIKFDAPFGITEPTRVKARVIQTSLFGGSTTSALNEQLYLTSPLGFPLRITELMYHPEDNEALEFIELQNVSSTSLDLTGFYFDGVDYRFVPGTWLSPKQIIVLIPNDDPEAFATAYPDVRVFGTYRKHLGNGGEDIRILDANDRIITAVTYDDDPVANWPAVADAQGHSLEVINPMIAASVSTDWRASTAPGGTPGVVSTVMTEIDSDKDGFTDAQEAIALTDPNDPTSFLKLEVARLDAATVRLRFDAQAGPSYTIQWRGDLGDAEWQTLESFPTEGAPSLKSVDAVISDGAQFYRLVIP